MKNPLLSAAFPFYLTLNKQLEIEEVGESLRTICPEVNVGNALADAFEIVRPRSSITFTALRQLTQSLVILKNIKSGLTLRYQILPDESEEFVFLVGNPFIRSKEDFKRFGLTLRHFALHDVLPDFMMVLQPKDMLIEETKDLAAKLRQKEADLVKVNETLETKVLERTAELYRAKKAAELANMSKSLFLANISHELRTPLNAIMGMGDLLAETRLNQEQKELLKDVSYSASVLAELVEQLLTFSQIEDGTIDQSQLPFSPRELLDELEARFIPKCDEKALKLNIKAQPGIPDSIIVAGRTLRKILVNLLSNAIKFTSEGEITLEMGYHLSSDTSSAVLEVCVSDTGIGIAEVHSDYIFDRFTQIDNSSTRKYGGSGIGLAVVKELVDKANGEISLSSIPGEGSAFTVRLPVLLGKANTPGISDGGVINPDFRLDVLVVEDNRMNQRLIEKVLKGCGCNVKVANNGKIALEILDSDAFDLILMDLQMPVMGGLEATRKIRQLEVSTKKTPIVALTANVTHKDRTACFEAGMNAFLSKPLSRPELYKVLQTLSVN